MILCWDLSAIPSRLAPACTDIWSPCGNQQQENSILVPGGIQPYGFNEEISAVFLC